MDSTNDTIPPTLNVLILTEEADDNPAERKQVMDDQKPIIVISDACCGRSPTVTFQFTVPSQTGHNEYLIALHQVLKYVYKLPSKHV